MDLRAQFPYLPIEGGNTLNKADSKQSSKKGMDNDDDYYHEVNADGEAVYKYHIWHHMSKYPPFKADEGWAKYDMSGNKIDSGKVS